MKRQGLLLIQVSGTAGCCTVHNVLRSVACCTLQYGQLSQFLFTPSVYCHCSTVCHLGSRFKAMIHFPAQLQHVTNTAIGLQPGVARHQHSHRATAWCCTSPTQPYGYSLVLHITNRAIRLQPGVARYQQSHTATAWCCTSPTQP